ncbi:class I SAM-dependent methyltransferase [Saccharothrix coeruleofusca]|uniref:Polyketide synthase protein n=1 Tax=Saccharothrix coeruleofusca TaxID=33919 RepID=A0A918ECD0_9PSEU|nr:class I SAM-dependent methyltransferase [Saccharothrix coeruleofusca]MBP2340464.1 methyltransferase (TIGR00027 family) [Saccharothrix coeruleofusca]GGP35182.1 putative polyketide synthase protein [Saccharothrix coeruleofusca]
MAREAITFTGTQETMLATLYARALDSARPDSVLHDTAAAEAVARIDYDFARTGIRGTSAIGVAIRARVLDDWTAEFLAATPEATVLHLACGLDTRARRMAPPPSVRWVDVDLPEVVELRRKLLPDPPGDYRLLATSVTAEGWLEAVPADRPVVAVFEGLTMYLRAEEVERLVRRITGHFPGGQLLFDAYGTLGIKLQKLVPAVRNAGATLHWGMDDPRSIEPWGVELVQSLRSVELPHLDKLPRGGRIAMKVLALLPGLRDSGRLVRYRF